MTTRKAVKPADAAGLVLIRGDKSGEPEILLGLRSGRSRFLPDIHVVPGGRLDTSDALPSGFEETLHPSVSQHLMARNARRPEAFLRAALRETFEETGLLIGRPAGAGRGAVPTQEIWRTYESAGIAPAFRDMSFVLRAITPRYSPRRFNTRFFVVDGELAQGELRGNGELLELGWYGERKLPDLRLVDVTQALLSEALRRWRDGDRRSTEHPKLLIYFNNSMIIRTHKRSAATPAHMPKA